MFRNEQIILVASRDFVRKCALDKTGRWLCSPDPNNYSNGKPGSLPRHSHEGRWILAHGKIVFYWIILQSYLQYCVIPQNLVTVSCLLYRCHLNCRKNVTKIHQDKNQQRQSPNPKNLNWALAHFLIDPRITTTVSIKKNSSCF